MPNTHLAQDKVERWHRFHLTHIHPCTRTHSWAIKWSSFWLTIWKNILYMEYMSIEMHAIFGNIINCCIDAQIQVMQWLMPSQIDLLVKRCWKCWLIWAVLSSITTSGFTPTAQTQTDRVPLYRGFYSICVLCKLHFIGMKPTNSIRSSLCAALWDLLLLHWAMWPAAPLAVLSLHTHKLRSKVTLFTKTIHLKSYLKTYNTYSDVQQGKTM